MTKNHLYKPKYEQSHALVIGINQYKYRGSVDHARPDAEAIADILKSKFDFPESNVTLLVDDDATCTAIRSAFFRFTKDDILPDARILIYFAGHGATKPGKRRDDGYLVPVDGKSDELDTLIRWDELTDSVNQIRAKHVLFLMDACYGGLAITRALPGSSRYLKGLLQRSCLQVLTAGKADERVLDGGGPRAGHSIFTGHLLEALDGAMQSPDGIISANAVMQYVAERVGKDRKSRQTPDYSVLEGDGDFIFSAPNLTALASEPEIDQDILIQVPPIAPVGVPPSFTALREKAKDYIAEVRHRIRLHDLVAMEVRTAIYEMREEVFGLNAPMPNQNSVADRLRMYESAIGRLSDLVLLLARWGTDDHHSLFQTIVARLADHNELRGGIQLWAHLRWYPLEWLMYVGGIGALAAHNYGALSSLLTASVGTRISGGWSTQALRHIVEGMADSSETFKLLPGREKHYFPRSEYIFKAIQPHVDELLFLGSSYESLFDRFEVLYALVYADVAAQEGPSTSSGWGPPGRFVWKHRRGGASPYKALVAEAEREGSNWPVLRSGLFGGSIERFQNVAAAYQGRVLQNVQWV